MTITQTNDMQVAGASFFADSESFLHELTEGDMVPTRGALSVTPTDEILPSQLSLVLCQ